MQAGRWTFGDDAGKGRKEEVRPLLLHHPTHGNEKEPGTRRVGAVEFRTIDAVRVADERPTRAAQSQQLTLHGARDGDDCRGGAEHAAVIAGLPVENVRDAGVEAMEMDHQGHAESRAGAIDQSTRRAVLGEDDVGPRAPDRHRPGAIDPRPRIVAIQAGGQPPFRARPPVLGHGWPAVDDWKTLMRVKRGNDARQAFGVRLNERLGHRVGPVANQRDSYRLHVPLLAAHVTRSVSAASGARRDNHWKQDAIFSLQRSKWMTAKSRCCARHLATSASDENELFRKGARSSR